MGISIPCRSAPISVPWSLGQPSRRCFRRPCRTHPQARGTSTLHSEDRSHRHPGRRHRPRLQQYPDLSARLCPSGTGRHDFRSRARENLREIIAGIHRAGELVRRIMPPVPATPPSPCRYLPGLPGNNRHPQSHVAQKDCRAREYVEEAALIGCTPAAFQQIMLNLCTNAYHAMQDGGGVLTITLQRWKPRPRSRRRWLRLTFAIPVAAWTPRSASACSNPCLRQTGGHRQWTRVGHGAGNRQSCRGRIQVSSSAAGAPSSSSICRCWRKTKRLYARSFPSCRPQAVRILFVDDEEHIRLSEKRLLAELGYGGYRGQCPGSPSPACRNARTLRGGITDLNMPGLNVVSPSDCIAGIRTCQFFSSPAIRSCCKGSIRRRPVSVLSWPNRLTWRNWSKS